MLDRHVRYPGPLNGIANVRFNDAGGWTTRIGWRDGHNHVCLLACTVYINCADDPKITDTD